MFVERSAFVAKPYTDDQLCAAIDELLNAGSAEEVRRMLPFAAYGQGPVVTTPFKLARVAATIANGGEMPEGAGAGKFRGRCGRLASLSGDRAAAAQPVGC